MIFPSIFLFKICKIEQNQVSRRHLHFGGKTWDQYGMSYGQESVPAYGDGGYQLRIGEGHQLRVGDGTTTS